ncbi:discoidin domain-containing protein [Pseudoalteromonas sp. McH1-7]|uniref:discoidin domain-containing protein n=1 Tax=unclassified Pseudoalteromonas TaxID=194690 RepID=UPI001590A1BB|nr:MULTISPECIES: discoidin domain-containing protein [unclassified Pseudoalteromonas]NUZ12783.1 discoidin domain-containing protein [Pseudoalteromonas sp. McH1-7]USD27527.1 discoidin domain-containing protein [Pseudoalteromonas sp. SCSIO 43201]
MNTLNKIRNAIPLIAVSSLLAACGGGSDAPKVEKVPVTPVVTTAEVSGSVIKGALSQARISVTALNGSSMMMDENSTTSQTGEWFIELTGKAGFGINSTIKVTATTSEGSQMRCDASRCGSVGIGEQVSGDYISGVTLATLSHVAVPFGSNADGSADATLQINALTTLATMLVEQQIAEGRNVSTPELMALAKAQMSAILLRALGWQTGDTNVFELPVVSADQLTNFELGETCITSDSGEQSCEMTYVSESVQKLSLFNAAFAQFDEQGSLQGILSDSASNLSAALGGDEAALEALRLPIYNALQAHPLTKQLGLSADSIMDLALPLFDEPVSTGPMLQVVTSGATITARNAISDAESADKAFDGDPQTKWLDHNDWQGPPTEEAPSWIQVDFPTQQAISGVYITSANDAPERDPENFSLLASNDEGASWVNLGNVVGASFEARFERQGFVFGNAQKYTSYRIAVTKNKNNDGLLQIGEIQFVGPVYPSVDHTDTETFAVTASNSIGEAENQDKAFDNDPTTKWLDHNDWQGPPTVEAPSWIQVDFNEAVAVNQLAITSANDAPERDPENFALFGSNDNGVTWQQLSNWVGESFEARGERQSFAVANQLSYQSYRLEITKNKNNDGLMQLAEIELIGPEISGLDHAQVQGASYTARFSISDSESAAQAFDKNVETKWLDHNDWQGPPTAEDPAWVQVSLPQAQAVNTLYITSANDAPERDPENFQLLASHDGEVWQLLNTWVGEPFESRFERRAFAFANGLAYTHYRLSISKNANNDGLVQIAEIELAGPQYALEDLSDLAGTSFTARNRIGDAESEQKAFDNDTETKWLDHNEWQGPPTEGSPSWIQADFTASQIVSGLAITSANDAPERDPENFQLLGSNDGGQTWTEVAVWVGERWDERLQRRVFTFSNAFAYRSYRLNISKNANNDGLVQISEIELLGLSGD